MPAPGSGAPPSQGQAPARPRAGSCRHPRLAFLPQAKAWMPAWRRCSVGGSIRRTAGPRLPSPTRLVDPRAALAPLPDDQYSG